MASQKYDFNWHSFQDHLVTKLQQMITTEDFKDVTLVTDDDKQIKAHRNILSACSPVLQKMLQACRNNIHPVIYLRGICNSEMESIIQFIYMGKTSIYRDRLNEFLMVANDLGIRDLKKNIEDHERSVMNTDDEIKSADAFSNKHNEDKIQDIDDVPSVNEYENIEGSTIIDDSKFSLENIVDVEDKNCIQKSKQGKTFHEEVWPCPHCEQKFSERLTLHCHQRQKHKGMSYFCNQCEYENTESHSIIAHIKSKHEGARYSCNQCDKQYTNSAQLKKHVEVIHEGLMYTCNQCNYESMSWKSVNTHIQSKHEGVTYPCNQCDFRAPLKRMVEGHVKAVHEGVKYSCQKCEKQYMTSSALYVHNKSVHEGVKYNCDFCDTEFTRKDSLTSHILSKHNNPIQPSSNGEILSNQSMYICNLCQKQFWSKKSLSDHLQSHQNK